MGGIMKLFICFLFLFLNPAIYSQWTQQENGLEPSEGASFAIDACNNNTAIIIYNNHIYKTENTGDTWIKIPFPASYEIDVSIIDREHFWVCTDSGKIFATSNGGTTWILQFYDTTITTFIDYIEMFNLNDGFAMGDSKNSLGPAIFLRTTDGGIKWTSVNDSAFGGNSGDVWRRIDFVDINTGYFFETGVSPQYLYKTTNGCKDWINTNVPLENIKLIKFYNQNLGLAAHLDSYNPNIDHQVCRICRTFDGGNSWETFYIDSEGWPNDFEFLPGDPSKVWYVESYSLYFSSDTGRTWYRQIYDANLFGRDLVFTDNDHGWLLCDGKLFHTSNNGGITSDVSSKGELIPVEYSLEQNFPNPFNPYTTIRYSIPKYSFVTLTVYDLLGREVQTLINEYKPAGKYQTTFNAEKLSNGVYIFTLKTGEYKASKKLIILK